MQTKNTTFLTTVKPKRRVSAIEFRHKHVEAWLNSNISMSTYCREQDLSVSSFSNWAQKYREAKTQFKPVIVEQSVMPVVVPAEKNP